ncbi:AAA-ATPase At5g17760 [Linum perenne]
MGATLSVLASVAVLRSTVKEFVPQEIRTYLLDLSRRFSSELIFRVTVGKNESMKGLTYGLDRNSTNTAIHFELRWFELRINRKHGELAKSKYIPYILESAKRIRDLSRVVKFYSTKSGRDGWSSKGRNLEHPMSFDTLAMDGDLKRKVIEDLDSFVGARDYYRKIGKVWKRGYLLYGPPGTGKSSLIAAMANYLNFDIYNLNLSVVNSDSSLEHLLLHMSNRSILVVEDIDCSVMLQNREAENRSLTENQNHGTPVQIPRPNQVGNHPSK